MRMQVYIDLYFLINVSMDLLCLMITGTLLHRRVSRWRAICAAILGGGYAVAALLLGFDGLLGFLGDCAAALLMCVVTFASRGSRFARTLRCVPVLVLVSMLLGGVMTGLYSLLNRLHLPFEMLEGDGLSVWTFALLTAVASIATVKGGGFLGLSKKTKRVTVHATLFGKEIELCAMVDSGNLLRDPVSGKSVIVAELSRLAPVLPPEQDRACARGDFTAWLSTYENARRARPIPTQTATGQGMLLALIPERLTLTVGSDTYPADYLIAPAALGESAQGFDAVISLH